MSVYSTGGTLHCDWLQAEPCATWGLVLVLKGSVRLLITDFSIELLVDLDTRRSHLSPAQCWNVSEGLNPSWGGGADLEQPYGAWTELCWFPPAVLEVVYSSHGNIYIHVSLCTYS